MMHRWDINAEIQPEAGGEGLGPRSASGLRDRPLWVISVELWCLSMGVRRFCKVGPAEGQEKVVVSQGPSELLPSSLQCTLEFQLHWNYTLSRNLYATYFTLPYPCQFLFTYLHNIACSQRSQNIFHTSLTPLCHCPKNWAMVNPQNICEMIFYYFSQFPDFSLFIRFSFHFWQV